MKKSLLSFMLLVVVAAFVAGCIWVPARHAPGPVPPPVIRAVPPPHPPMLP